MDFVTKLFVIIFNFSFLLSDSFCRDARYVPVPNLIESFGYTVETHPITTEDGYILEMYRIPHQKLSNSSSKFFKNSSDARILKKKEAVLLVHCIFCTSSIWVVQGPNQALSLSLADEGYDVWLLNVRGTSPSKKHKKLPTNSKEYWNFSWHEIAIYDLPAAIDYILEITKEKQLNYIGYSMGTTVFFALASFKPEYNAKIKKMMALAPACYLTNSKALMVDISEYAHTIEKFAHDTHTYEVPPPYLKVKENLHNICDYNNAFLRSTCAKVFMYIAGSSNENIQLDKLAYYFLYYPDTTSVKTVLHFYQVKNSGIFQLYNYGKDFNEKVYGLPEPPKYNLSQISSPVYLFYAQDDPITATKDVIHLKKKLPNVVASYRIKIKNFSHADFGWATYVKQIVYNYVLDELKGNSQHKKISAEKH